jgi:hypothetical protein
LDFNVDPMCSVICQPHAYGRERHQRIVEVVDEIAIPNSNVYEACEAFAKKVGPYAERYGVTMNLYADASGDNRTHVGTTAIQAVKQWFARHPNYRVNYKIPNANPAVSDRVRTVNSVLKSFTGEVRMRIDPKCKKLIADFEQVEWANEMGLEINKEDPKLTHVSDALGYIMEQEFRPVRDTGAHDGPPSLNRTGINSSSSRPSSGLTTVPWSDLAASNLWTRRGCGVPAQAPQRAAAFITAERKPGSYPIAVGDVTLASPSASAGTSARYLQSGKSPVWRFVVHDSVPHSIEARSSRIVRVADPDSADASRAHRRSHLAGTRAAHVSAEPSCTHARSIWSASRTVWSR